jgi:hypothetical protein
MTLLFLTYEYLSWNLFVGDNSLPRGEVGLILEKLCRWDIELKLYFLGQSDVEQQVFCES